ncbi:MAG: hypothetical protein WC125_04605 [Bacteroidales bacterium]|jgi:hypothetical protein
MKLYDTMNELRYMYRLQVWMGRASEDTALRMSMYFIQIARRNIYRMALVQYEVMEEVDREIASAIAAGHLMEDWIAGQISIGSKEADRLRRAWLRVAAIISTYVARAGNLCIDLGTVGEVRKEAEPERAERKLQLVF